MTGKTIADRKIDEQLRAEPFEHNQHTLVRPIPGKPGKFQRSILSTIELRDWFREYMGTPQARRLRFYVEPHNGVDNDAIISNWPRGFYS